MQLLLCVAEAVEQCFHYITTAAHNALTGICYESVCPHASLSHR